MGKINVQEGYRAIMKDYMSIYEEWLKNPYFDEATKEELRALEARMATKEELRELETRIMVTLENDVSRRISSLFDGYQMAMEKQYELERRVARLENAG